MRSIWWLPGASLIFFGVLIFIFPELLAFIVAAAFISLGAGMLAAQRMMRRSYTNNVTSHRIYRQQGGSTNRVYVE